VLSYGYLNTEITRGCCYFDPADPSALLPSARPSGGAVVSNGVLLRFQDLKGAHLVQSPENKIAANLNYTFDFTAGALTLSTSAFWTDETWYQPFDNPAEHAKAYSITDFRALWRDDQSRYSLIAYVKNAFDQDGVTSAGTSAPAAEFALGSTVVINGVTYQRQSGVTLTHGLVYPRTYGVELQYRF
jgi:iron complex outermembrane receptor protein